MTRYRKLRIRQHDRTDCGAACLASICAWYGRHEPLSRIREYASTGPDGTRLSGMVRAAEKLGFDAKAIRSGTDYLEKLPAPCIVHLIRSGELHHYAVLCGMHGRRVKVMDPESGRVELWDSERFEDEWSGVALLLAPSCSFEKGDRKVSVRKRLLHLIRPHYPALFQALLGACFYTLAGLSTAIYVQLIVDHVILDGNRGLLHLLGCAMIVILLLKIVTGAAKNLLVLRSGQLIDSRLLIGYFRFLLTLPQSFFDRMKTGEILSRISDAVKIRTFINDAALQIAVNLFIFLFSFALMFTTFWKLGLFLLAMLPAYLFIYVTVNLLHKNTQRRLMEQSAELESCLVESFKSISTIKQFGLEKNVSVRAESRFVRLLDSVYRSGIHSLFAGSSSELISSGFTIFTLWLGTLFVLDGQITTGELLSFYAVLGYFTGPVEQLIGFNKTLQDAGIAADRLFEILDLENEEKGSPGIVLRRGEFGDIKFDRVRFRYGSGPPLFENLTLRIAAGETTAIVGPSGSGKSSIAALIQKLYSIEKGQIEIGGIDLEKFDTRSLRNRIGSVAQRVELFSGTVAQNIAVGEPEPDPGEVVAVLKSIGMLDLLRQLPQGLDTRIGENGNRLSGGQKQRIAFARALYRKPDLLIMDEATSSLDRSAESQLLKAVRSFRAAGGTVLLIAHKPATVRLADRVILIEKGTVKKTGSRKDLV